MTGNDRRRTGALGFLVSFAIHLGAASAVLWPGGSVLQFSPADTGDPLAVVEDARAQTPTPARRGLNATDAPQHQPIYRPHPASNESNAPLVRDAVMSQAVVDESQQRRDTWAILQAIEELANSFQSHAAKLINHLWQSTVFAIVAGFLTFALHRNRSEVRYWLWFSASVKFFVPLTLLINLGTYVPWVPAVQEMAERALPEAMSQISQPFPERWSSGLLTAPSTRDIAVWPLAILLAWTSGLAAIALIRLQMWRRIRAALRASTPFVICNEEMPARVEIRSAPGLLEPGVVGWLRPILLLPAGIEEHLTQPQLKAVLAHELCHVRRRDNLTAGIHMITEALFWFHPLVWWVGSHLVDERERACDEEVVRRGHEPFVYAEGILRICKRYVESPLVCVPGVTGSDLKKRIEAIMNNQGSEALGGWKRLLLTTAALTTVVGPVALGVLSAPPLRAEQPAADAPRLTQTPTARSVDPAQVAAGAPGPAFETVSVKPNKSGRPGWMLEPQPGGRVNGTNVTPAALIGFAYELPDFQVSGGPDWLNSDRFDVVAKAEGDPPVAEKRLMLRRLLAERFKLTAHTETRQLPIYALVMARSDGRIGPQLRRSEADCTRANQPSLDLGVGPSPGIGPALCGYFGFAPGTNLPSGGLAFRGLTMAALAKILVPMVRRSVSDQTGLAGYFDADFPFLDELPPPPPPPGVPNPFKDPFVSVFTVFPEQLGLKLESRRGPVNVLVVDRAEQPTPD